MSQKSSRPEETRRLLQRTNRPADAGIAAKAKDIFSNHELKAMVIPLFFEQLLVMLVGLSDTLIVSHAGEAAVSGVSLVNQFNTIFIFLFAALASGGAVVISQYIGQGSKDMASESASQLLLFSAVFSTAASIVILLVQRPLLNALFGHVEPDVMQACLTYLAISAYSFPALAIYNAGAALFRSIGRTDVTMVVSILSNVINIVGDLLGVFVFRAGVAGVAWPSFLARLFSAVVITVFCFRNAEISFRLKWILAWNRKLMKSILRIAVPNGAENGVHQLVKVALSSIVAMFGTTQIAANGIAQTIWSLAALSGSTMGPVYITVIGRAMGQKEPDAAFYWFKRLLKLTMIFSIAWNLLIFMTTPLFLNFYAVSEEAKTLVIWLVLIHNLFNALVFPVAGSMAEGLRAAGDVRFTMTVSVCCTIFVRLTLSWLLGLQLQMGVIGIALAMVIDWCVRGMFFLWRVFSGHWRRFSVI